MKTTRPILSALLAAGAVSALAMSTGAYAGGYKSDRSEAAPPSGSETRAGELTPEERGAAGTASGEMRSERDSRSAGERISDQTLETLVKTTLIDDEQVKARNIEVEVRNGVVNLSGTVDSAAAAPAAPLARGAA